jgi:hypothetical protein
MLVDQFGRQLARGPRSISNFFEGGSSNRQENPAGFYNAAYDTHRSKWNPGLLDVSTWRQMLSSGRFLFANVPMLRGALLEQCNFSFPLTAHYVGKDEEWGKLAEEWVYEWQKNCNVRGPLFHSGMISRLRLIGRKVDGDIFTALIRSKKGDFPKTQLIRAHRVGDRNGFNCEVTEKPYKGMRSCNGAIVNDYGVVVAHRVLGDTADEDEFISANDMFPLYRPDYSDQYRGISELCATIRSWADIKRLREYEMRAQQLAASVALIEKNATGYADEASSALEVPDADTEVAGTPTGLVTESFEGGLVKYYKANSGSGLEGFRGNDRPAKDAQDWEDKIVGQGFYGIEWDPDFALGLKEPGGAWVRAKGQKIIRAIGNNVGIEAWAQEIETGFALGQAIADKVLPAPRKDPNIFAWNFSLGIPFPTVDSGNDEQALREAYKLGVITFQTLVSRTGNWWRDVRAQQKVETIERATTATELAGMFPEMSFKEWMFWLEQRTPNAPVESVPDGPNGEDKAKDSKDQKDKSSK